MRLIDADELKTAFPCGESVRTECVRATIDHMQTIEPERKKVKWKEYDSDEDKYDVIKCPCCMHMFTVDSYHWTDIGFVKDDFKFCPNCGADMREGEE